MQPNALLTNLPKGALPSYFNSKRPYAAASSEEGSQDIKSVLNSSTQLLNPPLDEQQHTQYLPLLQAIMQVQQQRNNSNSEEALLVLESNFRQQAATRNVSGINLTAPTEEKRGHTGSVTRQQADFIDPYLTNASQ